MSFGHSNDPRGARSGGSNLVQLPVRDFMAVRRTASFLVPQET